MKDHFNCKVKLRCFYIFRRITLFLVLALVSVSCSLRREIPVWEGAQRPADAFRIVDSVTLSAIGDIMVHDAQLQSAWDPENRYYNFDPVFSPVQDLLSAADLTIGNLETTLPGRKKLYSGYPQFGAPDALVSALKGVGIDILTTANNHACDKGRRGLVRTIRVLDAHGILHLGTYRNKAAYETQRILMVERKGIRLAFLSYTYGINNMSIPKGTYVNLIDRRQITDDIKLARGYHPDFIIVLLHFGTEYERYPNQFQKEMVEFLFYEGVDIVLGSHPHVLQPFELRPVTDQYGDTRPRLVIYSLGNFVSNQRSRYRDGGIVFNFTLEKRYASCVEGRLNITNVHYILTWVHIHRSAGKNQFYVLPVPKYLKNDQALQLPDDAYQKMVTFYKDTELHLKPIPNPPLTPPKGYLVPSPPG